LQGKLCYPVEIFSGLAYSSSRLPQYCQQSCLCKNH